jgi:hypothetical protein
MKIKRFFPTIAILVCLFLMAALAYGGATFSRSKTFVAGDTLTATDLNAIETNILNNFTPAGMDDQSSDVTAMRVTVDPYPANSESLATSLQGELERLRYVIAQITGRTYWYQDPTLINFATGATIASATTTDVSTATGNLLHISGAATTSAVTMKSGQWQWVIADGAWPLTYHATNLNINGGVNYTCTAGDRILFHYDGTTTFATVFPQAGVAVNSLRVATSVAGTVDAITAIHVPVFTNWVDKMHGVFRATGANTITTPTFAPDGLAAKTFVKENLAALVAGDIAGAGHEVEWIYNSTANKVVLLNPKAAGSTITIAEAVLASDITTTSTSFTTTGHSLTLAVGPSGIAMISIFAVAENDGNWTDFRINRDAGTEYKTYGGSFSGSVNQPANLTGRRVFSGLSAGNHTFLVEWLVSAGTTSIKPATKPNSELLIITGETW